MSNIFFTLCHVRGGAQSEQWGDPVVGGRGLSKWRGRVWVFPRHALHTAVQSSGPAGSRCGGLRDCIGTDRVRKLGLINLNNFYFLHVKFPLIRSHYEIYIATQDVLRDSLVAAVCSEVDFPWRSAKLGSRCFTHSLQFKNGLIALPLGWIE